MICNQENTKIYLQLSFYHYVSLRLCKLTVFWYVTYRKQIIERILFMILTLDIEFSKYLA